MNMDIISVRLRQLRTELGIEQKQAAAAIGVSQSSYSMYENGSTPPVDRLIALAQYFDASIDYLLGLSQTRKALPLEIGASSTSLPMLIESIARASGVDGIAPAELLGPWQALVNYYVCGAPAGHLPLTAMRALSKSMQAVIDNAAAGNIAQLVDAASRTAKAGVSALDILKAVADRPSGPG